MALTLPAPAWEAPAPQARGVHGLHRHVEYPKVADAVIEALEKSTREGSFGGQITLKQPYSKIIMIQKQALQLVLAVSESVSAPDQAHLV